MAENFDDNRRSSLYGTKDEDRKKEAVIKKYVVYPEIATISIAPLKKRDCLATALKVRCHYLKFLLKMNSISHQLHYSLNLFASQQVPRSNAK
jgi:hypothetical protein